MHHYDPQNKMLRSLMYALRGTAVVAGAFCLAVFLTLCVHFFHSRNLKPHNIETVNQLSSESQKDVKDEELKELIRDLDLISRRAHFANIKFHKMGGWLLLIGAIILLSSLKGLSILQQRYPDVRELMHSHDLERDSHIARWSLMGVGGFFVVLSLVFIFRIPEPPVDQQQTAKQNKIPTTSSQQFASREAMLKNWPYFRGPMGNGISLQTSPPIRWNEEKNQNVKWKTLISLPGHNSPIVWEDRVFLTGATDKVRKVFAFDANTGKMIWEHDVTRVENSPGAAPRILNETGFAAATSCNGWNAGVRNFCEWGFSLC